jgi:hypothetical protein
MDHSIEDGVARELQAGPLIRQRNARGDGKPSYKQPSLRSASSDIGKVILRPQQF